MHFDVQRQQRVGNGATSQAAPDIQAEKNRPILLLADCPRASATIGARVGSSTRDAGEVTDCNGVNAPHGERGTHRAAGTDLPGATPTADRAPRNDAAPLPRTTACRDEGPPAIES